MDILKYVEFYSADKYNYLYNIESNERKAPYVDNVLVLLEDYLHFNGDCDITSKDLPMSMFMSTYLIETKLYEDESLRRNHRCNGRILEKKFYEIEIYRTEYISSDEHKIYFKVINTFSTLKEFLEKITKKYNYTPNLHRRGGE